ncbi:hypothetical protein ACFL9S_03005 [Erwinia sp. AnSW2-5]|uniref:hypothetical protein n=1 Tax=Erwinia sp. AnSW2-5 TaxID=3367692 RepID=UPI003860017D
MKPSLIDWQTYTRIVGNLARQKKYSAILLTINEKGFANRCTDLGLGREKKMAFHPLFVILATKLSLKNRETAFPLACCTDFFCFALTIGCAFAKTLWEAECIWLRQSGFHPGFCVYRPIYSACYLE